MCLQLYVDKIVVGASYKITFIDEFFFKLMFHFLKQKNQALNKKFKHKIYTKSRHVKPWLENCNANWNNFIEHNFLPIMLLTKKLWFDQDILFLGSPTSIFLPHLWPPLFHYTPQFYPIGHDALPSCYLLF